MGKRILALVLASAALLLTACQANPTQNAVTRKDHQAFLNRAQQTGTTPAEGAAEQVSYHDQFTSTDGSITFNLNIDQELLHKTAPVVEVVPHFLSGEEVRQIAQAVLPDASFYEYEPDAEVPFSKSALQKKITLWSPYATEEGLKELEGPYYSESDPEENNHRIDVIQRTLSAWSASLPTAPAENPHTPCQWTFKKESAYQLDETGTLEIRADAETSGWEYGLVATSRDQRDYRLNAISIQVGGHPYNFYVSDQEAIYAQLLQTCKPTQQQLDAVRDKAQTILDRLNALGMDQWQIAEVSPEVQGTGPRAWYSIAVDVVPVFNGVPALNGQLSSRTLDEGTYAPVYYRTLICLSFSLDGTLLYFGMDSPLTVKQTLNDNVLTMTTDELLEKALNQLKLSDIGNGYGLPSANMISDYETYKKEKLTCTIDLTSIHYDLSLGRIKAPGDDDTYYYVPFFTLNGTVNYYGADSGNLFMSSVDIDGPDQPLICLNAIDGTVVSF